MIKSRIICAGHIACRGEMGNVNRVFVRKWEGMNHLEDLDIDVRIILK
jgi:hypothetical protein